jgi:hypothetical protein
VFIPEGFERDSDVSKDAPWEKGQYAFFLNTDANEYQVYPVNNIVNNVLELGVKAAGEGASVSIRFVNQAWRVRPIQPEEKEEEEFSLDGSPASQEGDDSEDDSELADSPASASSQLDKDGDEPLVPPSPAGSTASMSTRLSAKGAAAGGAPPAPFVVGEKVRSAGKASSLKRDTDYEVKEVRYTDGKWKVKVEGAKLMGEDNFMKK